MPLDKELKNWEGEFDNKEWLANMLFVGNNKFNKTEWATFLTLIEQKVRSAQTQGELLGAAAERERIVEIVKGMKKNSDGRLLFFQGYDSALSDLLSSLSPAPQPKECDGECNHDWCPGKRPINE
jgi:hypothetical protein